MRSKVSIVTHYPLDPMHPRTEMISKLLTGLGAEVTIHNPFIKKTFFQRMLLKLFLGYFDFVGSARIAKRIDNDDLVIIQGLTCLPISKYARRKNIPVIYETLDNNVHLYFFYLSRRYPILKSTRLITGLFERLEKKYVGKYADITIVNSKALLGYFDQHARLIYYSSPLEDISNQMHDETALLYLGSFEKMKGALQILEFAQSHKQPLLIMGTISEPTIGDAVKQNRNVKHFNRISSDKLKELLTVYTRKYFLLGMSLTQAVNLSNQTQELNKDIDYLAMGIPIIGNTRKPTAEKIEAGCGVYFTDHMKINELLHDAARRKIMAEQCREYYGKYYSNQLFNDKFKETFMAALELKKNRK